MAFPTIYPFIKAIYTPAAFSAGSLFMAGRPTGVTVHYTADRDTARVRKTLKDEGLGYHLLIDRDGSVIQLAYLNSRVNHAGKALWKETSPNRWHAAVSLVSWGKLNEAGIAWNGTPVPPEDIVYRAGLNGKGAYWDGATRAQEDALVNVLSWFIACGVDVNQVCGHDECALPSGRKQDPGGVLQWPMSEVRGALLSIVRATKD